MYIFVTFLIVIFFGISAFLTFVCDNSIRSGLVLPGITIKDKWEYILEWNN